MITLLLATTLFFALTSLFLVRRMILLIDRNRKLVARVNDVRQLFTRVRNEADRVEAQMNPVEEEEEWPEVIGING